MHYSASRGKKKLFSTWAPRGSR